MALPPTLPLLEPSAEHWSSVQQHWTDSVGTDAEARLLGRFELLRPYLQEAVRELAVRHYLLMDEPALMTRLALVLAQRTSLPSNATIFRYHVASLALWMVKEESLVRLSRLDDPMAPWHALRGRVNQLRRSFRAYFLAFLPKHSFAPMLFEKPRRQPSKHWVSLWDSLTDGIPGGGIPSEWTDVRDSYSPVIVPGAFANRGGGLIAPARDWKEILAKPLLQAAALIESRRPGLMPLYFSSDLLPNSAVEFARRFRNNFPNSRDQFSSDTQLKSLVESLRQIEGSGKEVDLQIDPLQILELAKAEGASPYKTALLQGAILDRQGSTSNSRFALSRMLQSASSREEIGLALTNLAVNAFSAGDYESSLSHISEALQYAPWKKSIRMNAERIRTAIAIHGNKRHNHGS